MSSAFTHHQFCLQDGHLVDDTMLLKDYLVSSPDALNVERDKTPLGIKEQLDAAKYRVSEFTVKDTKSARKLTETNVDNNTVKHAPKATFRFKKGLNIFLFQFYCLSPVGM
ncbi:unnamed protein product [Rhizoctonia solani]|nr:unnamed protein product [Rhizoctonia solani]